MPVTNAEKDLVQPLAEAIEQANDLWTKLRDIDQVVDKIANERDDAIADAAAANTERDRYERDAIAVQEVLYDLCDEINGLLDDFERGVWDLNEVRGKVTVLLHPDRGR